MTNPVDFPDRDIPMIDMTSDLEAPPAEIGSRDPLVEETSHLEASPGGIGSRDPLVEEIPSVQVETRPICSIGLSYTVLVSICASIIIVIVVLTVVQVVGIEKDDMFAIVIDAGSSSSKIYTYKWTTSTFLANGMIHQFGKKLKTKLSLEADTQCQQITKLVKQALKEIPSANKGYTRLLLGATAGMRLLQLRNASAAQQVIDMARNELAKLDVVIKNKVSDVAILSGFKEGLYAWISTNYLHGTFGNRENDKVMAKSFLHSSGSLDLGGASTQIAFATDNQASPSIYQRTIYGQTYNIYAKSFICYGKFEAEHRFLTILAAKQSTNAVENVSTFDNPCAPASFMYNITSEALFQIPCRLGGILPSQDYDNITNVLFKLKNKTLYFKGNLNTSKCKDTIKELFHCSRNEKCYFNNNLALPEGQEFYAFAGYYYTAKGGWFNDAGNKFKTMEKKIVCKTSTIKRQRSFNATSRAFKYFEFFDVMYVITLLRKLGFKKGREKLVKFVKKIDGADVSWTIGYLMDSLKDVKTTNSENKFTDAFYPLLIPMVVILAIFLLTMAYVIYKRSNLQITLSLV